MRILFLTTQLPYPPISGGVIKSWRLVQHFANHGDFKLRLICALKNDDALHMEPFRAALPDLEVFAQEVDRPRSPLNLLKSYLRAPTLNVYRNQHPLIAAKAALWAKECDVIIVDHYEMGQYVPTGTHAKVVLHQHNAEYVMWERLATYAQHPLKRLVIQLEAGRIKRTEKKYAGFADLIWAAPNDIEELVNIGVDRRKCAITYHLGEDEMLQLPDLLYANTEECLLFVGTLTWEANIDGLVWFIERVWPILSHQKPRTQFYIVGKNPDARITALADSDQRIHCPGFVADLEPYHKRARVFVIPLRFGSGIKVKLLNALYRGIPTVTTPIGTEGLEARHGTHLFVTSDPEAQAASIISLLENEQQWTEMRNNARELARSYSWQSLLQKHDNELRKLVGIA